MQCPSCNQKLANITIAEVLINVCEEGCGGIWLDRGELPKIAFSGDAITQKVLAIKDKNFSKHDQLKKCPRDQLLLKTKTYMEDQAVVDECPQCAGIWIDNLEEFLQVVSDFRQKKNLDTKQARDYFSDEYNPS
jgi:Zn-finger nucleic acid-binding protein